METFKMKIDNKSKTYGRLLHYCSLDTLEKILCGKTLRASSLGYEGLNDKFEKSRIGIEKFANFHFIVCFSNYQQEIVPFWYNYAGVYLKDKVLIKFKNFTDDMTKIIHTDYFYNPEMKKMFFVGKEYYGTINRNGFIGEALGLSTINTDFNLKNAVARLNVKDVKYLPINNEVFRKVYKENATISLEQSETNNDAILYDIGTLGHYKTEHWAYEHETRLIFRMQQFHGEVFDFILLRLKDKIFEDLVIVENPWANSNLRSRIKNIISKSNIDDNIKKTIIIETSELYGLLSE